MKKKEEERTERQNKIKGDKKKHTHIDIDVECIYNTTLRHFIAMGSLILNNKVDGAGIERKKVSRDEKRRFLRSRKGGTKVRERW